MRSPGMLPPGWGWLSKCSSRVMLEGPKSSRSPQSPQNSKISARELHKYMGRCVEMPEMIVLFISACVCVCVCVCVRTCCGLQQYSGKCLQDLCKKHMLCACSPQPTDCTESAHGRPRWRIAGPSGRTDASADGWRGILRNFAEFYGILRNFAEFCVFC